MVFINNNDGTVQISDSVLIAIIQTATREVDGVLAITSKLVRDIIGKVNKKNTSKGVHVINEDKGLLIHINISIKIDYEVSKVAEEVQKKVKLALENMTDIHVYKIDINITSIGIGDEEQIDEISEEVKR